VRPGDAHESVNDPMVGLSGLAMQGVAQPRVPGSAWSRGVGTALALCLMMGVSGAVAGDGAAPPAEPSSQRSKASSAGAQADKEQPVQEKPDARRTVRQPLRSVLLEGVPMRDAVARWSKDTGLTVLIDWDALEQENINPDAPVTLKVICSESPRDLRLAGVCGGTEQACSEQKSGHKNVRRA
jgi:hypothetical protein